MDYLFALVGFLLGSIIGSMLQFYFSRNSISRYAGEILMGSNSELQLKLDFLEAKIEGNTKKLTEKLVLIAELNARLEIQARELILKDRKIKRLEERIKELEKNWQGTEL